ncbi:hypothetical protein EI94DRAFT_1726121 [Lactarius quietus]|nr:hypothetical protein EI94DRAFT_1726121 [Lactarius quietus]
MRRNSPPSCIGGSQIPLLEVEMVHSNNSLLGVHRTLITPPGSSLLPSPTLQPRAQRRSPPTTKGKALLPVLPLDIVIGVNQPRGTKRSATVAAHIDGPNEDQGEDSEPGPRKAIISVRRCQGRRVRFQSPPESRPKQRLRVGNGPEAASNEMWVAVGEDMCKPCKLVGREVCKPRWKASEACKSWVFCTGQALVVQPT